jgi:hypothetical protein
MDGSGQLIGDDVGKQVISVSPEASPKIACLGLKD